MVILYGLVRRWMDDFAAGTMVAGLCCFPSAPVLQVAYTESLSLMLVVLALRALSLRQHGRFVVFAALLAVTRPVLLPLGALSAGVWLVRWYRRRDSPFPLRERVRSGLASGACLMLIGAWPLTAAIVTGDPAAFTTTMSAWPTNKTLGGPEVNWLSLAAANPLTLGGFVAPVLAVVMYAAIRRPARLMPGAWRWWAPLYMVYVLAATKPSNGILRYLLLAMVPLAPLAEPRAPQGKRAERMVQIAIPALFAVAGLVGQYYWVLKVFTIDVDPLMQPFP